MQPRIKLNETNRASLEQKRDEYQKRIDAAVKLTPSIIPELVDPYSRAKLAVTQRLLTSPNEFDPAALHRELAPKFGASHTANAIRVVSLYNSGQTHLLEGGTGITHAPAQVDKTVMPSRLRDGTGGIGR